MQKTYITKILWGNLGKLFPQFFGCGGNRPHGVGAYDSSTEHYNRPVKHTAMSIAYMEQCIRVDGKEQEVEWPEEIFLNFHVKMQGCMHFYSENSMEM